LNIRRTPGGLGTDGWVFKDLAVGDAVQSLAAQAMQLPR